MKPEALKARRDDLAQRARELLAPFSHRRSFGPGDLIFREGDGAELDQRERHLRIALAAGGAAARGFGSRFTAARGCLRRIRRDRSPRPGW